MKLYLVWIMKYNRGQFLLFEFNWIFKQLCQIYLFSLILVYLDQLLLTIQLLTASIIVTAPAKKPEHDQFRKNSAPTKPGTNMENSLSMCELQNTYSRVNMG